MQTRNIISYILENRSTVLPMFWPEQLEVSWNYYTNIGMDLGGANLGLEGRKEQ